MITHETTGLAAERREKIRTLVRQRNVVRVDELCEELGVSAATVRRDLGELDLHGQIRRVHGGAIDAGQRLEEQVFDDKASVAAKQKQRIAEQALQFVGANDSVFLDGGSTVLALARLLANRSNITVVTNSLRVAGTLSGRGPRMILVGGELRRISQTFVGSLTQPMIDSLHVDTAFMGTIGLSTAKGLTTTDPREAFTKGLVMHHARRVILLADSSKIGKVSFARFGTLEEADVLITDGAARRKDTRAPGQRGVEIVIARIRN